jgi:hypothetical protein
VCYAENVRNWSMGLIARNEQQLEACEGDLRSVNYGTSIFIGKKEKRNIKSMQLKIVALY